MSKASKPDKDMGTEVNQLGGYRPNTNRFAAPVIRERQVEIVIIAPLQLRPKPVHWWQKPFITLGP